MKENFLKKKVLLFLYGPLSNSGVPHVMLSIVKSLSERIDFTFLAMEGGSLDKDFKDCGVNVVYMKECRPTSRWRRRIYDYTQRYQNIAKQLEKFLSENQFDVFHSCGGFDCGLYLKIASKMGIPIRIMHCHGKFPKRAHNIFKELQNLKFKKLVERYVTVKIADSKAAGDSYFLTTEKMYAWVNPVDIESYRGIIKTEAKEIRALQIGIFNENKNQLFSLSLLKKMLNNGIASSLTLIGYDYSFNYEKKMGDYIKENNLQDNVTFLPPNADKKEVFKDVDVLLLPSYTEACPLVALEAQAAGVPVIASINVPIDVDFGLCKFLPLNEEHWYESLKIIKVTDFSINEDFVNLTPAKFGEKIYKLYCGESLQVK